MSTKWCNMSLISEFIDPLWYNGNSSGVSKLETLIIIQIHQAAKLDNSHKKNGMVSNVNLSGHSSLVKKICENNTIWCHQLTFWWQYVCLQCIINICYTDTWFKECIHMPIEGCVWVCSTFLWCTLVFYFNFYIFPSWHLWSNESKTLGSSDLLG